MVLFFSSLVGTLIVRQYLVPGFDYLNITIDKIEIKNAKDFIDPFFTVSLKSERLFEGDVVGM